MSNSSFSGLGKAGAIAVHWKSYGFCVWVPGRFAINSFESNLLNNILFSSIDEIIYILETELQVSSEFGSFLWVLYFNMPIIGSLY